MRNSDFVNMKLGESFGWHDRWGNYNQATRVLGGAILEFHTESGKWINRYIPISEIMNEPNGRSIDAAK